MKIKSRMLNVCSYGVLNRITELDSEALMRNIRSHQVAQSLVKPKKKPKPKVKVVVRPQGKRT